MAGWSYEGDMKITIPYSEEEVVELVRPIERSIVRMLKNNQRLEETIEKLKSEAYKDEELAMWKSRCEKAEADARRGFPISEKEDAAIKKWTEEHEKIHPGGHGCSGGKYSYHFVPTAIGTSGVIKCSCGAEFEFQEIG